MSITIKPLNTMQVDNILTEIAPREAHNLARATNHGVAGVVRNEIKKVAPKDSGKLKKSVKAKREKARFGVPYSTVRIGAFYWRFLEIGTSKIAARPFVDPTVERLRPRMADIWREQFGKKLQASLRRKAKKK